jgi:hypothetical protein
MEIINNLPVIISAFFTILIGLYGYVKGLPNTTVYQDMCLFLVVFYLVGFLLKRTILGIMEEVTAKAEKPVSAAELLYQEVPLAAIDVAGDGGVDADAASEAGVGAAEGADGAYFDAAEGGGGAGLEADGLGGLPGFDPAAADGADPGPGPDPSLGAGPGENGDGFVDGLAGSPADAAVN